MAAAVASNCWAARFRYTRRIKTQRITSIVAAACAVLGLCAAESIHADDLAVRTFNVSEHAEESGIDEVTPGAASAGQNALIVWKDNRNHPQANHRGQYQLFGRRFDLQGRPLDAQSFSISSDSFLWNAEGITLPTVGAMGSDYMVTWVNRSRELVTRRVRGSGKVEGSPVIVSASRTVAGQPAFAASARSALVVWTERVNNNGDIRAAFVNRQGKVTRTVPLSVNEANAQFPVAASSGSGYVVLWRELNEFGDGVLNGASVSESGAVTPLHNLPENLVNSASVAAHRDGYIAKFQSWNAEGTGADVMGCRLTCRGTSSDAQFLAATDSQAQPIVLSDSRGTTVVWREHASSTSAQLRAVALNGRGAAKAQPSTANGQWSGYGTTTLLGRSNLLTVIEQRTPDYAQNGLLSRVRGSIVARPR
jgi:hypothetical protein